MSSREESKFPHVSPFDTIRHLDDEHGEYWSAREFYKILGYTEWRNFNNTVIKKAMRACEENGRAISEHFVQSYKAITGGKGAKQEVKDVLLSRYAAYLVVMNGDSNMPVVAMGQEYFAEQTRRQELAQAAKLEELPEDQKRLVLRSQMAVFNGQLARSAQEAGVVTSSDFQIFQDHGYRGLYGGLSENDIHASKHLKTRDKILDYMGSEELGANIFRATQTDAKLKREEIHGKAQANQTHLEVGKIVRKAIAEVGGTMPENLPTPDKSIQQLQREEQKRLTQRQQPSLFELPEND